MNSKKKEKKKKERKKMEIEIEKREIINSMDFVISIFELLK